MIQIRPWLYHGKMLDVMDFDALKNNGIEVILQLSNPVPFADIETLYLPVHDGVALDVNLLREGVEFVLQRRAKRVLVACAAGISRSTTFNVAILKETENLSLQDALREIRAVHRFAYPHSALWKSLCEYYGEPYTETGFE